MGMTTTRVGGHGRHGGAWCCSRGEGAARRRLWLLRDSGAKGSDRDARRRPHDGSGRTKAAKEGGIVATDND
ncbi:ATP-binding protein [Sesbania bispinosa]|nr:ATP-binding protein [Sesbania bispinosa]